MPRPANPIPVMPPTPEDEDNMAEADLCSKPTPFVVTQPVADGREKLGVIVDTPTSPSSAVALSRFEFEAGKGNEGTKILMVEWDSSTFVSAGTSAEVGDKQAAGSTVDAASEGDTDGARKGASESGREGPSKRAAGPGSAERKGLPELDDWVIAWDGKNSNKVVAVRDAATTAGDINDDEPAANGATKRVYFLLPPGVSIPTLVTITPRNSASSRSTTTTTTTPKEDDAAVLRTKPMPAIFPASLGPGTTKEAGLRGVLHTIWAKQRLADLQAEIEAEMISNSESIGLQIAIQEHEWITEHFGVSGTHNGPKSNASHQPSPLGPAAGTATPRSPIGGKLSEKLRGLKLATSPAELAAASQASKVAAIATRSAQGEAARGGSTKPAFVHPRAAPYTSIDPPGGIHHSLDAVVRGEHGTGGMAPAETAAAAAAAAANDAIDGEDELFVLPMSPRSPEMAKSPFSFL